MPMSLHASPHKLLLCTVAAVLMLLAASPSRAGSAPSPEQASTFLENLSTEVLAILSNAATSIEEREQHVRELMDKHVAIDFIARFALGKYWARASEDERADYTELFRSFFLHKYAAMLGGYENQTVTIEGAKPAGAQDTLVSTSIIENTGAPPIRAGWRLRLFDDRPLIIDIIIEGISMALNQRQEFKSVLAREGMGGLLDVLRETIERVPAQAPA